MQKFLLIALGVFASIHPSLARKSCGSASCPINNSWVPGSGLLTLSLSQEYINQNRLHLGTSLSFVGALPGHHDEIQTVNDRTVLQIGYGLSDRLALQLSLPFIHREHSHIDHDNGGSALQSWSFSGIGDLSATAQVILLHPQREFDPFISFSAGVKFATGATGLTNDAADAAEVTIQPGTGSTDGILGMNYRQTVASVPTLDGEFGALPLIVGLSYQLNGKGTDDYRFGNVFLAHLGTMYQCWSWGELLFQINGKVQDYADVGATGEPRENTGGRWIFASPGFQADISDQVSAYGYLQLPLYQNVHGLQQTSPFNLLVGVTANFNLLGNPKLPGSHME